MNIDLWMSALVLASMHILLSLAFTLTYRTIDAPNFSIGLLSTIGAYQSFILSRILNVSVYIGIPLALVSGFIVNSGIYLLLIKPLLDRERGPVLITLATLALSLLLTSLITVAAYWLHERYDLYTVLFVLSNHDFSIGSIRGVFLVSSLTAFLTYFTWRHIYWKTQAGITYRALLENPQLAGIQGIDKEKTWLYVWGFSGSLACLAGALVPMIFSFGTSSGAQMITAIIAVSILGGLRNPRGFFIGGLIVGISEIMLTTLGQQIFGVWFGEYRPFIPMIILVLCLRFRSQGLLGKNKTHYNNPPNGSNKLR